MLSLTELQIEHRLTPLGLDETSPDFSWILCSDENCVQQTAYKLQASVDGETVWDTGRVAGSQSIAIRWTGPRLMAQTRYDIEVTVWDNMNREATANSWFETGLLDSSAFRARWITHALASDDTACPVFIKSFDCGRIVRARLYASACGIYDILINDERVGEDFLAPGWTNYKKRIQYQTYDITHHIRSKNELAMTVAPGWYKGLLDSPGTPDHYGDRTAALLEIHLWFADGQKRIIASDESWHYRTGEVRYAELYNGETADTTHRPDELRPVCLFNLDRSLLLAQQGPPVRIVGRIEPVSLIQTPKGEIVLDFGQNMAGFIELTVDGKPGQAIVLRHAEVLDQDGNFYTENLRSARATDTFICRGGQQVLRPRFTFHGFRYVCVDGLGNQPQLESFKACVLSSVMAETADFSCSNPLVDRLWQNIKWGQLGNFIDIPTDCPQRDERLGWTGDATVFARTAGHLKDVYSFFQKWLADLASEQSGQGGVPHVIPSILPDPGGAAVWSDAATIIPWTMYQLYGDPRILKRQYASMKGWIEYMRSQETPRHLRQTGHQFGDWLALDREEGKGNRGATDRYLIATVFYAFSTKILAETAAVLGIDEDAAEYSHLYENIRAGYRQEYITATGRLVSETQTACILTLYFDLCLPEHRQRIIDTLVANLNAHQGKLTTGFIGTPYLCHTLTEIGRHDLAGKILLNEDYPGWLNEVKLGATTIWERWDSMKADGSFDESGMNSFNHYAFGAIGDWLIERLAGIQLSEPGYSRSVLRPQFIEGLTKVSAGRRTPYGRLACAWSCQNGLITIDVVVPVNTKAVLHLPERDGVQELGSGRYHFEYATATRLEPRKYSMDSTISAIIAEPAAVRMIEKAMPGSSQHLSMAFLRGKTISELLALMPGGNTHIWDEIIDLLNETDPGRSVLDD